MNGLVTKELYSRMTDQEKIEHHRDVREDLIKSGLLKPNDKED